MAVVPPRPPSPEPPVRDPSPAMWRQLQRLVVAELDVDPPSCPTGALQELKRAWSLTDTDSLITVRAKDGLAHVLANLGFGTEHASLSSAGSTTAPDLLGKNGVEVDRSILDDKEEAMTNGEAMLAKIRRDNSPDRVARRTGLDSGSSTPDRRLKTADNGVAASSTTAMPRSAPLPRKSDAALSEAPRLSNSPDSVAHRLDLTSVSASPHGLGKPAVKREASSPRTAGAFTASLPKTTLRKSKRKPEVLALWTVRIERQWYAPSP